MKNEKISKEEKNKIKEHKILEKFLKRKYKVKNKYLTRCVLIKKYRNAQTFTNSEFVNDNGIIKLRDNSYARVYSVDAIDLSLTSNIQKQNFFHQLKYLYQLKGLNLRIYKLDDKIDLVIDTPSQGVGRSRDGFLIRRYAIETGVTCLTSLDTADALLTSLETGNRDQLSVVDIAQI